MHIYWTLHSQIQTYKHMLTFVLRPFFLKPIFILRSTCAPYSPGACGIFIFIAAQSMLDPSLWEKHEWKQIVCWHITNASFYVIMGRLLRVLCSQGCTIACGLRQKKKPAYPTFLLYVSLQLVLSSHKYQWGLIFLVHVCGIVQAQF